MYIFEGARATALMRTNNCFVQVFVCNNKVPWIIITSYSARYALGNEMVTYKSSIVIANSKKTQKVN